MAVSSNEWQGVVEDLLSETIGIEELKYLSPRIETSLSPMIKTTLLLERKLIENGSKYNVFVLPKTDDLMILYILSSYLLGIRKGDIKQEYNIDKFQINDILSCGTCRVQFLGKIENAKGTFIKFRSSDLDSFTENIVNLPVFVKAKGTKKLSKLESLHKIMQNGQNSNDLREDLLFLNRIAKHRGHFLKSVAYVGAMNKFKEFVQTTKLEEHELRILFHFSHVDNLGQLSTLSLEVGAQEISSIIVASDSYALTQLDFSSNEINQIVMNCNSDSELSNKLSELDDLKEKDVSITVFMDPAFNEGGLKHLDDREFKIWDWNKSFLTENLIENGLPEIDTRLSNCFNRKIKCHRLESPELKIAFDLLRETKIETEELRVSMNNLRYEISDLLFSATRNIRLVSEIESQPIINKLNAINEALENERQFVRPELYKQYEDIIRAGINFYDSTRSSLKYYKLLEILNSFSEVEGICVIVPDNHEAQSIESILINGTEEREFEEFKVLTVSQYFKYPVDTFTICLISCWLKKSHMRKILYSYREREYHFLLFDHEDEWRRQAEEYWKQNLDISHNSKILSSLFGIEIQTPIGEEPDNQQHPDGPIIDYVHDPVRDFEYSFTIRRFGKSSGITNATPYDEVTSAIPIEFEGGYIAFFKPTKEVIVVTDIVNSPKVEDYELKMVQDLFINDFIAIRESDRDLIRDIADRWLSKSEYPNARQISEIWSTAFSDYYKDYSLGFVERRFKNVGSDVGKQTIRNWGNKNVIIPKDVNSLIHVGKVMDDEEIIDRAQEIFDAGRFVQNAHVQAGHRLTKKLKKEISRNLQDYVYREETDSFPITFEFENVGEIKVHKIINIGESMKVLESNLNRLQKIS